MNTTKGFTLIELMVTLAVIAVLVAVGLPQITGMSSSNRLSSYVNSLSGDISYARSEAINRNANVNITSIGGNWANGWTVTVVATGQQLRTAGPTPAGFTIAEAGNIQTFTYSGEGLKTNNNPLTFTVCETGTSSRLLEISAVGRVSFSRGAACP